MGGSLVCRLRAFKPELYSNFYRYEEENTSWPFEKRSYWHYFYLGLSATHPLTQSLCPPD